MKNNEYDGRGILYRYYYSNNDEDKNIEYNGYFKKGKYEGFGKKYEGWYEHNLIYIGFFINNEYNGKGTLYSEDGNKKYEGYFKNGKYNGIGIEYYKNALKEEK